jgi:hypothetical protein
MEKLWLERAAILGKVKREYLAACPEHGAIDPELPAWVIEDEDMMWSEVLSHFNLFNPNESAETGLHEIPFATADQVHMVLRRCNFRKRTDVTKFARWLTRRGIARPRTQVKVGNKVEGSRRWVGIELKPITGLTAFK